MRSLIIVALAGVVTGCARDPASRFEATVAPIVTACQRITKSQVGQLPLDIEVGGKTVRMTEWTIADETATDAVGFAAQLPADVEFTVQAGDRTFRGNQGRWLHPEGVSGPRVKGIEALTFCTSSVAPAIVAVR